MIDNKYFTPDIENVRVGYECETYHGYGSANTYKVGTENEISSYWNKSIFTEQEARYGGDYNESGFDNFCDDIKKGIVRVPYLYKEQIENEGWKFVQTNKIRWWYEKNDVFFECPMTTGYQIMRLEMLHDPEYHAITIKAYYRGEAGYNKEDNVALPTIFEGYCKDINTFRIISKLLGILYAYILNSPDNHFQPHYRL